MQISHVEKVEDVVLVELLNHFSLDFTDQTFEKILVGRVKKMGEIVSQSFEIDRLQDNPANNLFDDCPGKFWRPIFPGFERIAGTSKQFLKNKIVTSR